MKIALVVPSRTNEELKSFLANLKQKTTWPKNVEIVNIIDSVLDAGDDFIEEFPIKYFVNPDPTRKYSGLSFACSRAISVISDDVYFVGFFSSKTNFKLKNWDVKLEEYKDLFSDDIYRLRISKNRNVRYGCDLDHTLTHPENFSFCTKKLLDILCGNNRVIEATDSGLEAIFWFLNNIGIYDREIVANDLELEDYDFSKKGNVEDMMIRWNFKFLGGHDLATNYFREMAQLIKDAINASPEVQAKAQKKFAFLAGSNQPKQVDRLNHQIRRAVELTYDHFKEKYGNL